MSKGIIAIVGTELKNYYKENTNNQDIIYKVIYILSSIVLGIFIIPAVLIYRGFKSLVNLV